MELLLLLGGPLLVALLAVGLLRTPRSARPTIGPHGLRWSLRTGHMTGWATLPALLAVFAALAWPELLVRSLVRDDFGCGHSGFPACDPIWPTWTLTLAAASTCVVSWSWLRTGRRQYPAELRVDTDAVHLGRVSVPWSDIAAVRLERRGWPIRYRTLILEANPPVRVAVDCQREDTIDRVLTYLSAATQASQNAKAPHSVPRALEALRASARPAGPRSGRTAWVASRVLAVVGPLLVVGAAYCVLWAIGEVFEDDGDTVTWSHDPTLDLHRGS